MAWFLYDNGLRLERVDYLKTEKLREKIISREEAFTISRAITTKNFAEP